MVCEIEPEVAKESGTRKRKADRSSWEVSINKKKQNVRQMRVHNLKQN